MTRADKWTLAGGLALAIVGLAAAAALVWLAIDAAPPPLPTAPLHDLPSPRSVPS